MSRIEDVYSLTHAQEGIYVQSLDKKNTKAYQLYYLFEIDEKTDVEKLKEAIRLLAVRHPVLRTAFAAVEGRVKQVVLADREPYMESMQIDSAYKEGELDKIVEEKSAYTFDLQKDSLMRCFFIEFLDKKFFFLHTHHLITDGWSMSVLFRDLYRFYQLLSENNSPEMIEKEIEEEKAKSTSFASYVNLVRAYDSDEMKNYWAELLSEGQPCTLTKKAKTDKVNVLQRKTEIKPELRREIEEFSRRNHIPVNTVLEAVFSLTLHKYTGMEDLIYNKTISGKSVGLPKLEQTAGPMINTVPVRVSYSEETTNKDYIKQINTNSVNANEYGFLALSDIYRSNGIDPNEVDVLFIFENYDAPFSEAETPLMQIVSHSEKTEFPLTVILSPESEGYTLEIAFDNSLISDEFVEAIQSGFVSIAKRLIEADENSALSDCLQLTDEEKEKISFIKDERKSTEKKADDGAKKTYEAPQTETEEEICRIFCEMLKVERFGRNDSFFDYGGTSLQIVKLLSFPPLDELSPSDFLAQPTPAALAKKLDGEVENEYTYIAKLYKPQDAKKAIVLFPFAGGDASAYTALVAKAREEKSDIALFFVDWFDENEVDEISDEIRLLSKKMSVCFYSHCAGSALAMMLLDNLNEKEPCVKNYIAGASIPPRKIFAGFNSWIHMSDAKIYKILSNAGMDFDASDYELLHEMLESFRSHTKICSDYFNSKKGKTNVSLTALISRKDPLTKNYSDAKNRWQNYVTDVENVVLIDTPSHYFQNTEFDLILSLAFK